MNGHSSVMEGVYPACGAGRREGRGRGGGAAVDRGGDPSTELGERTPDWCR